jgi:hypothetical protein
MRGGRSKLPTMAKGHSDGFGWGNNGLGGDHVSEYTKVYNKFKWSELTTNGTWFYLIHLKQNFMMPFIYKYFSSPTIVIQYII